MMTILLHLLTTYAIFSLFFVVIALFGGIFVYTLQKYGKKKWNLSLLEFSFLSFAVGILIYIVFGYMLSFFKIFNFYSAYLPFLVLAAGFLIVLYKNKTLHELWAKLVIQLKSNYKNLIIYLSIFSLIFGMLFFLMVPIIEETSALVTVDPYYWTKNVLYLTENGTIDFLGSITTYPWGFLFYSGGSLLISPDFTTVYYFMKLACFPFLNLYILIMYSVSKRLFKKKILIFFCLITVASNIYFVYRSMAYLSSSISVMLILISVLIFLTGIPKFFLGFLLPAIFLINPAYCFFFLIALSCYYMGKLLLNSKDYISLIKEISMIASITLIFLVIYGISLIIFYNMDIISVFELFFRQFEVNPVIPNATPNYFEIPSFSLNSMMTILDFGYLSSLVAIISVSFYYGVFIIFPIFGVFLRFKSKDSYLFVRICSFLAFIIAFIFPFLNVGSFFELFYFRIMEAFLPTVVILAGFTLEWILTKFDKIWLRRKLRTIKSNSLNIRRKLNSKYLNFSSVLSGLVIFSTILVFSNAKISLYHNYFFDNSITECVFYSSNSIESNASIAYSEVNGFYTPFDLLYNHRLFPAPMNYNLTLSGFQNFTQQNGIGFCIIKLSYYNTGFRDDFFNSSSYNKLAGGSSDSDFQLYQIV